MCLLVSCGRCQHAFKRCWFQTEPGGGGLLSIACPPHTARHPYYFFVIHLITAPENEIIKLQDSSSVRSHLPRQRKFLKAWWIKTWQRQPKNKCHKRVIPSDPLLVWGNVLNSLSCVLSWFHNWVLQIVQLDIFIVFACFLVNKWTSQMSHTEHPLAVARLPLRVYRCLSGHAHVLNQLLQHLIKKSDQPYRHGMCTFVVMQYFWAYAAKLKIYAIHATS